MKLFRVSVSGVLLVLVCSIALTAQSVQTDYDRSYNLAQLKTYDFSQPARKPGDPLAKSPGHRCARGRHQLYVRMRKYGFE